jgi:hypothetical protein
MTDARSIPQRAVSKGHGSKLPRKQEQAIAALLESDTLLSAASKIQVAEKTLRRWLGDPEFSRRYAQAKRQLLDSALSRLRSLARRSVDVLEGVATDEKAPHASRVTAASRLLDGALRLLEVEDVENRLTELERKVIQRSANGGINPCWTSRNED